MRAPILLVTAGVLLGTTGCSLRPQLVKHHDSSTSPEQAERKLTIQGDGAETIQPAALLDGSYVITGFSAPVPPSAASAPFISKLSDHGQAQLIEQVGASAQNADELTASLLKLGEKPAKACNYGPLRMERRLVLSLAGRHAAPASRFDSMAYVFELKDAQGVQFTTWNRFDTQHETVALGTTRMKQSQNAGWTDFDSEKTTAAATAIAPAKELFSSLNLTASQSRELEETIASARRFTPITGTLSGKSAALVQQGAVGMDLFGNMTADFTIELKPGTKADPVINRQWLYTAAGLFDAGKPQPKVAGTTVSRCERTYAWSIEPIKATLTAAGVLRQVGKGGETVIEGDDEASYTKIEAKDAAIIELVDSASLIVEFYTIRRAHPAYDRYNLYNLTQEEDIQLPTLDEARNWVKWLRQTGNTELKGTKLGWLGPPIAGSDGSFRKSEAASLEVYRCESITGPLPKCEPVWR